MILLPSNSDSITLLALFNLPSPPPSTKTNLMKPGVFATSLSLLHNTRSLRKVTLLVLLLFLQTLLEAPPTLFQLSTYQMSAWLEPILRNGSLMILLALSPTSLAVATNSTSEMLLSTTVLSAPVLTPMATLQPELTQFGIMVLLWKSTSPAPLLPQSNSSMTLNWIKANLNTSWMLGLTMLLFHTSHLKAFPSKKNRYVYQCLIWLRIRIKPAKLHTKVIGYICILSSHNI